MREIETAAIGHNSTAVAGDIRDDLERILTGDTETLFIYAQWHVNDYIAGTRGMSLEHEGAYQRFLMNLYSRGKPLPDDDSFMARVMALSTRVWRRIKDALVASGKIVMRGGCLTNARFERERRKRAEELQNRSRAALIRWQQERENAAEKPLHTASVPANETVVSPKFAGSLPKVSAKLCENEDAKSLKNNDADSKSAYANQYPITFSKKKNAGVSAGGASGRRWAERDPFGLNPWQAKEAEDVKFDADFRLEVHNGFQAELANILLPAGLDLREALDEAARWIPRAAPPSELKISVRSQITRQAREAKERATARAPRQPPKTIGGNVPARDPSCPDHVWQKMLRGYVARREITQSQAEAAGLLP
jgi:uncharacterized protein YdaU (DUF1376 family)